MARLPTYNDYRRAFELILGGPARPFELTVREADLLRDALDTWVESYTSSAAELPTDEHDEESDRRAVAQAEGLKERLHEFMIGES